MNPPCPRITAEAALAALTRVVNEFSATPEQFTAQDWSGLRPGPRILLRCQHRLADRSEPELVLEGVEVAFWVTQLGEAVLGPAHAHCCRADPHTAAAFDQVARNLITRAVAVDSALSVRRAVTGDGGQAPTET